MQQFRPSVAGGNLRGPAREIPAETKVGDFDSGQERAARIRHEINNKISQFRVWRVAPENHGSPLNAYYVTRPRDEASSSALLPSSPSFYKS